MLLTPAQNAAIKADILAKPDLNVFPDNQDGAFEIKNLYNLPASPPWVVWKTLVPLSVIFEDGFNKSELAARSQADQIRLSTLAIYAPLGVNPSKLDVRQAFDDIFSGAGGANTRVSLLALWKRTATRLEKLLSTGTGSTASPATMTFEGEVSYLQIFDARRS